MIKLIEKITTMSNETYDSLKKIECIVIPTIATFYATFAEIWGLPYADKVSATLGAIAIFLGGVLLISSKVYTRDAAENKNGSDF